MSERHVKRRLAAILVADVVGYGRLVEANEEATVQSVRQHYAEAIQPVVARLDGRIFKFMGEGFLAEFSSAVAAVSCGLEIQSALKNRQEGVPVDRQIRLRIGINLGDVMVDGDDLYGDDVNIAARITGLAAPGGIACSNSIHSQLAGRLDVRTVDIGLRTLKNIAVPLHVHLINPDHVRESRSPATAATSAAQRDPDRLSVAVLPFANMSRDPEQEFFSDGITEDIITDLSKVSELFVLSRNTVFRHKGKPVDMEQVANDLGVAYLVHGSVRQAGAKVRVTAQLIEGASGGHVWADRYDRDMTDIFDLQDEITKTIVQQLKVKLLPGEKRAIEKAPTSNVEAYTFYLRGREYFHRGSRANYLRAKEMFAEAIRLDPVYARAYAGLADCDAFLYMDYSENVAEDVLLNSERALALQSDLVEARASHGLALSIARQFEESEREFKLAIAQDPDHFEVRFFYGRACYAHDNLEQTAVHWERAAEIKPDDYQALILLNQVYTSLGRPEDARRVALRGMERAERAFARSPDDPRPAYFIATTLAKLGDADNGEVWVKRALEIAPDDYLTQYNVACFYSVCGAKDQAFAMLDVLLPRSNAEMRRWILVDSDLDPLRGDPRWIPLRAALADARDVLPDR